MKIRRFGNLKKFLFLGVIVLFLHLNWSCVTNPITRENFKPDRSPAGSIGTYILGFIPIVGQLIQGEWVEAAIYGVVSIGSIAVSQLETLPEEASTAAFAVGGITLGWAAIDGLGTAFIRDAQNSAIKNQYNNPEKFISADISALQPIYPAIFPFYEANAPISFTIENQNMWAMEDIRISVMSGETMDFEHSAGIIDSLEPSESETLPIGLVLSPAVLSRNHEGNEELIVNISFRIENNEHHFKTNLMFDVKDSRHIPNINAISAFVTPLDVPIRDFARAAVQASRSRQLSALNKNLQSAFAVWAALSASGVSSSANLVWQEENGDLSVSKPRDVLRSKSGSPADLAVLYASLLEKIGVPVSLITDGRMIAVAVDMEVASDQAETVSSFPERIALYNEKVWLVVSMDDTSLQFIEAWDKAIPLVQHTAREDSVVWLDIREQWTEYPPMPLPDSFNRPPTPDPELIAAAFAGELESFIEGEITPAISRYTERLKTRPSARIYNVLAVTYARFGQYQEAIHALDAAIELDGDYAPAWVNKANIFLLEGDTESATAALRTALTLSPENTEIMIRLIKIYNSLGEDQKTIDLYRTLSMEDPLLAGEYRYLISAQGNDQSPRADYASEISIQWVVDRGDDQ